MVLEGVLGKTIRQLRWI